MNWNRLAAVLAAAILAAPGLLAAPGNRPSKSYTIEQFMKTVGVSGAPFTAD